MKISRVVLLMMTAVALTAVSEVQSARVPHSSQSFFSDPRTTALVCIDFACGGQEETCCSAREVNCLEYCEAVCGGPCDAQTVR